MTTREELIARATVLCVDDEQGERRMNGVKIVIADDDASLVALVEKRLTDAGYTVSSCGNGNDALELVAHSEPVILLADWQMPGLTGVELCEKLQVSKAHGSVYIILLTANGEPDQVVAGFEAGADDYLVKPAHPVELLARVRAGERILRLFYQQRDYAKTLESEVAERKQVQEALLEARDELEKRVEERTARLADANASLEYEVAERKGAEKRSQRKSAVLEAINEVFQAALACETEDELGRACLAVAENLSGSKFGFLGELNPAGLMDTIAISNPGWDACKIPASAASERILNMPIRGIDRSTIREEKSRIVSADEMATHPDRVGVPKGHPEITAFLGVPLKHAGKTIGMIGLGNKPGGYELADQEAVEGLSVAIVEALRYRRAEVEVRQHRDHLEELVRERTTAIAAANTALRTEITERKRAEEEREKNIHDLGERVKELTCMYGVAKAIRERESLEEVFRDVAMLIPPGWHYPEITRGRIRFNGKEFVSEPFEESEWCQTSDLVINGELQGSVEVYYLEQRPELDEGPFMKEERRLIDGIAHTLSEAIEHKRAGEQVEQADAQLLQSAKMVSIGQLAAGIAHEINNPIGFISSNLHSLGEYVNELKRVLAAYDELLSECGQAHSDVSAKAAEVSRVRDESDIEFIVSDLDNLVKESVEGTKRVRKIVADLRDFSHVDSGEVNEADINELLDKTINVAWNELKYKTEVVREYGQIPAIPCYGGKLGQVFLNLLVNAAHAIEEHGTITVRTGSGDSHLWVEVEDTGCGMPADVMDRVFDPFFTTKEVGKGTGMGLNLAYNIIESHGGRISVDSRVGEGTTFRIELPVGGPPEAQENRCESVA